METLKFNKNACNDYISSIEDFEIDFKTNEVIDDIALNTRTILIDRESVKSHLKKFIIECEDESKTTNSAFLQWLNKRKIFWRKAQFQVISAINIEIEKSNKTDKARYESKRNDNLNFLHHVYHIIEMIEKDLLNDFQNRSNNSQDLDDDEGKIYLYKEGKQMMSSWDYFNKTGQLDGLKNRGMIIYQTENFEVLKQQRAEKFESEKQELINKRKLFNLNTTNIDLDKFESIWLENELKVVEKWLSEKTGNKTKPSFIKQIELGKYNDYVNEQIKRIGKSSDSNEYNNPIDLENNIILSTIEDYIDWLKEYMTDSDYQSLVAALKQYFDKDNFPKLNSIKIRRVNKKKVGWALNQLCRSLKNGALPTEYLLFAKQSISLFSNVEFNENDIKRSNLYKYFTTKI